MQPAFLWHCRCLGAASIHGHKSQGRGTAVTGRVQQGTIKTVDHVEIFGLSEMNKPLQEQERACLYFVETFPCSHTSISVTLGLGSGSRTRTSPPVVVPQLCSVGLPELLLVVASADGGTTYGNADLPCELGNGSGNDTAGSSTAGGGITVLGLWEGGSSTDAVTNASVGPGGGSGGILLFMRTLSLAESSILSSDGGFVRAGSSGGGGEGFTSIGLTFLLEMNMFLLQLLKDQYLHDFCPV